jgi:hypothetical protein
MDKLSLATTLYSHASKKCLLEDIADKLFLTPVHFEKKMSEFSIIEDIQLSKRIFVTVSHQ